MTQVTRFRFRFHSFAIKFVYWYICNCPSYIPALLGEVLGEVRSICDSAPHGDRLAEERSESLLHRTIGVLCPLLGRRTSLGGGFVWCIVGGVRRWVAVASQL